MVRPETARFVIDCRCGRRFSPCSHGLALLSFLLQHQAPDDLVLESFKCRDCGTIHLSRLRDVAWRVRVA